MSLVHAAYSNGPGWAEMLATQKKLEVHNYAQGGATIDNDVVPGLIVSSNTMLHVEAVRSRKAALTDRIFAI